MNHIKENMEKYHARKIGLRTYEVPGSMLPQFLEAEMQFKGGQIVPLSDEVGAEEFIHIHKAAKGYEVQVVAVCKDNRNEPRAIYREVNGQRPNEHLPVDDITIVVSGRDKAEVAAKIHEMYGRRVDDERASKNLYSILEASGITERELRANKGRIYGNDEVGYASVVQLRFTLGLGLANSMITAAKNYHSDVHVVTKKGTITIGTVLGLVCLEAQTGTELTLVSHTMRPGENDSRQALEAVVAELTK